MNNQAKFEVDVAETEDGFMMRLIRPSGAVFLSRTFHSKFEAEDARDSLVAEWGGPIGVLPTLVRKTVMVPDAQGIGVAAESGSLSSATEPTQSAVPLRDAPRNNSKPNDDGI